jgi:hypothetical protein
VSVAERFRDVFRRFTPWFLSDRSLSTGESVGYRYLWALLAPLDAYAEVLVQGLIAPWPGLGTPTALALIGRSRGIIRGRLDTDEDYALKLRDWLNRAREWGGMRGLAIELAQYLGISRLRVINRAGRWVTYYNGSIIVEDAAWDWDSVSHPERAGDWSDEWIIVYSPFAERPGALGDLVGEDGYALGHLIKREEVDATLGIIAQTKGAHSRVRAVIWTTNPDNFQPGVPASCPDGTWGAWGTTGSGSRVKSGRFYTNCRFWEPR